MSEHFNWTFGDTFSEEKIPKNWKLIPIGVFFREKSIKNTEGELNLSVYRDFGVIIRDSRDDNFNRVSEDTSNYKLVEPGDLVLNKMKCWMGSLGVSQHRGIVSPSYTVLKPTQTIDGRYFHHLLRSELYRQIYESLSYGVRIGQWELRFHDFKIVPATYPPILEQQLISQFLDKKIFQIDTLIEKLEKKIQLLEEFRVALISHCVTKGLNPEVAMKASGIEWLGEIPKNWTTAKLKHVAKIQTGTTPPISNSKFYFLGTTLWVKPDDLNEFIPVDFTQQMLTNSGVQASRLLEPESALVCGIGSIGKFGYSEHFVCTNQQINGVTFNDEMMTSRFGLYLICSLKFELEKNSEKVVVSILSKSRQANISVPKPPIEVQHSICEYLDKNTSQTDSLIEKLKQKISLQKEYRQTLISSVVTGKVRVTECDE